MLKCISNDSRATESGRVTKLNRNRWTSPSLVKTTCSSKITLILSFCVNVKVKEVKVSIGSSGGKLSGISKGSFGIEYGFWNAPRSSMLNVELMPISSGKSIT